MTDDNFLLWKFQILTALEGYNLESHLENDPPAQFLDVPNTTSTGDSSSTVKTSNPAYMQWKRQDKVVSSWLVGSMSEDI
ncbi:MAG: hypothetical protein Q8835_02995, partial [Sweet potato little leaf phytoplasma]|nr:hypothetical protein [Sweet potato little leaf phytoplasma]